MNKTVKVELNFSPEERDEYVKAYRTARKGGKNVPDTDAKKKGSAAVKNYRTRVNRLKDYVDGDSDISVLEGD